MADDVEQQLQFAAKPAKSEYRRNLPHIQRRDSTLFVTFRAWKSSVIPTKLRSRVMDHCLRDHGTKLQMHAAAVMPDHVHLLFTPLVDGHDHPYGLAEIMSGIKGASAHTINRALTRRGHVWQDESFDRALRTDEDVRKTGEYIVANPVRAGLAAAEDEWAWLWREWVEGAE